MTATRKGRSVISLLIAFAVLVVGYLVYGRVTEMIFATDDRETPAVAIHDGVDCVPMKTWKAFLVQLLNIAGTGPIFGALMGAVFGPVVFVWIVLGSILGGAVHDYMSGMISERHGGASIAELSGIYLGSAVKWIMRVFSVVLLVLCGTVFVTSPAALLARLTPGWMNGTFWAVVILAYYLQSAKQKMLPRIIFFADGFGALAIFAFFLTHFIDLDGLWLSFFFGNPDNPPCFLRLSNPPALPVSILWT